MARQTLMNTKAVSEYLPQSQKPRFRVADQPNQSKTSLEPSEALSE